MRIHPVASLGKRNITIRYEGGATGRQHKKLRRLPHIFSRVLELPFTADADVVIEEGPTNFRFIAAADGICADVRAHPIQIHPGVVKIVIRDGLDGPDDETRLDELELDRWRFRLPHCTRPALVTAAYVDGELVVTVPKEVEV